MQIHETKNRGNNHNNMPRRSKRNRKSNPGKFDQIIRDLLLDFYSTSFELIIDYCLVNPLDSSDPPLSFRHIAQELVGTSKHGREVKRPQKFIGDQFRSNNQK